MKRELSLALQKFRIRGLYAGMIHRGCFLNSCDPAMTALTRFRAHILSAWRVPFGGPPARIVHSVAGRQTEAIHLGALRVNPAQRYCDYYPYDFRESVHQRETQCGNP
jgi:hypothetical protein